MRLQVDVAEVHVSMAGFAQAAQHAVESLCVFPRRHAHGKPGLAERRGRLVVETVGYFLTVSPSNTINRLSFGKTYPDPVIAIAPGVYPVAVSQASATDSSRRY
jgi:hypothetical protein